MIEQRIKNEGHVVEHAFFSGFVSFHPVQGVELDLELTWRMRAEVVDLNLLGDKVAVVSALQFASVELDSSANYDVLLDEPNLELFVEKVPG